MGDSGAGKSETIGFLKIQTHNSKKTPPHIVASTPINIAIPLERKCILLMTCFMSQFQYARE